MTAQNSFPVELFEQALPAIQSGDMQTLIELCADDVVFEFPFAPPGGPARLLASKPSASTSRPFPHASSRQAKHLEMHQTLNPDVAIVEMTAVGCVKQTGRALRDVLRRGVDREQWPDCALPRLLEPTEGPSAPTKE